MFLGKILAQPSAKRHVGVDFVQRAPDLEEAFRIAGQGALPDHLIDAVRRHQSITYLQFDGRFREIRPAVIDFTRLIQQMGGIAPKIESTGIAHEWSTWFDRLQSENPFDWYRSLVVLVGDTESFFSCGMHLFGLPDVEISRQLDSTMAADLMNRFNYWRLMEAPVLNAGETFSLTSESPRFALLMRSDHRHPAGDPFRNPHGVWRLEPRSEQQTLH